MNKICRLLAALPLVFMLTACGGESAPAVHPVSMAQFEKVEHGMTYKQVEAIFGSPGHYNASNKVNGQVVRAYSWDAVNDDTVLVVFAGDRVIQTIPGLNMYSSL